MAQHAEIAIDWCLAPTSLKGADEPYGEVRMRVPLSILLEEVAVPDFDVHLASALDEIAAALVKRSEGNIAAGRATTSQVLDHTAVQTRSTSHLASVPSHGCSRPPGFAERDPTLRAR